MLGKGKEEEKDMGKGIKFTVAMGILALFGCIQLGCEQPGVKKEAAASPQAEEKAVAAKQPEASAPEVQRGRCFSTGRRKGGCC